MHVWWCYLNLFSLQRAIHQVRSEKDFYEQVKNAGNKLVVVEFFATWFQPSKGSASSLEKEGRPYAGKIVVLQVNLDEVKLGDFATKKFGISLPTFLFIQNGKVVEKASAVRTTAVERAVLHLTNSF